MQITIAHIRNLMGRNLYEFRQFFFLTVCAAVLFGLSTTATASEKVVLQLRWEPQFQFAGYYAALWEGYYKELGLDVEIRTAVTSEKKVLSATREVAEGRAQFGIGSADILIARDKGAKLTLAAAIFQKSPVAVFARKDANVSSPADLTRVKVRRIIGDLTDAELIGVLEAEGINPSRVKPVMSDKWDGASVEHLLSGRLDAYTGYTLTALWKARQKGITLTVLRPATYGVDFYGDSLFTTEELAKQRPELVSRFVAATVRGWKYALSNRAQVAEKIGREMPRTFKVGDPLAFNTFQAEEVAKLILHPVVQLGHVNPVRWAGMHDHLKRAGMVDGVFDQSSFHFDPKRDAAESKAFLQTILLSMAGIAVLIIAGFVVWTRLLRNQVALRTRELSVSESRFRNLVETMNEGISVIDSSGIITYVNYRACTMFGYSSEEMVGASIQKLLLSNEEQRAIFQKHLAARSEGSNSSYELDYTHKDGHTLSMLVSPCPMFDSTGAACGSFAVLTDVTEQRKAQKAIAEKTAFLEMTLECMGQGVCVFDAEGSLVAFNQSYVDMYQFPQGFIRTGMRHGEILRKMAEDGFLGPGNVDEMVATRVASALSGEARTNENTLLDGSAYIYHRRSMPNGGFVATYTDITERKNAERTLHETAERLAEAQHIAHFGHWRLDHTNNDLEWSDEVYQIFEIEPTQFSASYEAFLNTIHPEDREKVNQTYTQSLKTRAPYEIDHRLEMPDGRIKWVHERCRTEFDKKGNPVNSIGTVQDITDRKNAEKALYESEARFRDLIEGSPLGIQIVSSKGKRLYVNKACVELAGYESAEEFLTAPPSAFVAPHDQEQANNDGKFDSIGQSGTASHEFDGVRKDGSIIPLQEIRRRIVWDGQEAVQRTFINLTEIKKAERALRSSEERLAGIMQNAADGIVTINAEGVIEEFNAAAERIFGYSAEEAVGQNVSLLMPEPDRSRHDKYLQSYLLTGRSRILNKGPRYVEACRKDDSTFPLEIAISEMIIGEERLFIGIARDITERKEEEAKRAQLELQLRQAQKNEALGTLAGGIAHEFNNLLLPIMTFTEFAQRETPRNSSIQNDLSKVMDNARRAAQLVERILSFSHKKSHNPKPVDLRGILYESVDLLRATLSPIIQLRTVIPEESFPSRVDEDQIHQIILNLANNAAHAMDGRVGHLTIGIEKVEFSEPFKSKFITLNEGSFVRIFVTDDGDGMDTETIEKIFDPFFTTKEVGCGTGLGLSLVHGIVVDHGGGVDVTSELGRGTTVDVYLPLLNNRSIAMAMQGVD